MANNSDMNVALRFQADVSQARAELKALSAAVQDVGKAPQVDTKAIDHLGNSAKRAAVDTQQPTAAFTQGSQSIVAAIQQMTAQMGSMSQRVKGSTGDSAQAVDQSTKSIISNIQRQLAAMQAGGTGTEKYFRALKDIQGQSGDLPTWLGRLGAAEAAVAQQMTKSTMSAKQYAAAMRILPMQMTDIVVGLSTGQSPFMVAMQQGGQLKDMFGGIAPAAKAVSGAVMGMVNPFTLAAAGVGVLTAAWLSGRHEQEAYARSIITTGNAAGTSVGKLTAIAQAVGEVTGSYGKASEAAAGLAATGKVSNDVIAQAAMATTAWARSTDTDISSMVQSFAALGEKPAEASRQLNEQYNYLTTSVYQQIKALEEQGRKDEAAALAQRTFANAMKDRADEVKAQLNGLGQAANWVGKQFSSMWNQISNIGRVAPLTEQLADAQKEYKKLLDAGKTGDVIPHALGFTSYDSTKEARARVMKQMSSLQQQIFAEEQKANAAAKAAADADAGIKATDSWNRRAQSLRNWKEQLADVTKEIRAEGQRLGKTDKEIQDQIDRQTEKLTPKTPKGPKGPKTNAVDTAFQSQLQSLETARAQAEQGLANAEDKVGSKTDQASAKLEAWLSVNKNALKLDDARIAQLREVAAETDSLNKATKDLQETKARNERITQGLAAVEESISQAQGRTAEAAATRIEERFRKLRDDLGKTGNMEGLAKVDQLVGIESARAQLESLQQQADRIFSDQSRTEQSLANQVTAGLTGELEAKRQILNINTSTAAQVEALLPKMRELAEITGNPAAIDRVKDLEVRIQGLRTKANEVSQAFGNAFGNSLSNSLKSLVDGTASLGEAVRGLLSSLATGMGEWAAQQLALRAQEGVMGLINGASKTAAGAGAASAGSTAAAGLGAVVDTAGTAADAAATAASTAATVADTVATTAATAATTAMATAATAAAVALQAIAASSASSGASSVIGALGAGFSSGGWTGPGTKFQPAGIVHANEFVNRQEVVRQPGALAFLTRFNQIGMAALKGWHGYADGGLVVGAGASLGIPSAGNFKPATPAMGGSTTLDNQQNFYLVDDPERIASMIGSKQGEKAIAVMISRNPGIPPDSGGELMALPLWTFPPNWGSSVKETLEWLTDVLQSPSGAEQRRALRLAPRRSFSFEVLVHQAQRTRSDLLTHVLGAQPFALPIWTDAQYLDGPVAADSSVIAANTTGYDFAAGGLAVLASEDWSICELLDVDQVAAGGLSLASPTLHAWPVGSRLLPARKALLQSLPEPVRMTDELARASVSFELIEPCSWPAQLPAMLYRGKPVLESRPDESNDLTLGYERLTQWLDNQVGIPRVTDTSGYGFVLQQHAWALWGRDEHSAFRSLLYGLRGRQAAIWVPTHAADLVAAGQVQGQTLQVQPCGYADLVTTSKARMGRQDIRIELATGEALHRRITAAAADAELETLALDQALPAGVSASAITRISFMALCRLAEDSAEITHHTDADGLAKATLKFRGVRADLEAA